MAQRTSPQNSDVARHYERYPYPGYPIYSFGNWNQLSSVDISNWGLHREARDLWICGCGTIAPLMFARRNPQMRIVATDLSRRTIGILRRRLWLYGYHNLHLMVQDLMESAYENSFDAVDAFGVIHHVESPEAALLKLEKSLRPGGVLRLMIYSDVARTNIENLRSEVRDLGLSSLGELKKFLHSKDILRRGDFSNDAGLADSLFHPLVHIFDRKAVDKLLASARNLEIVRSDSRGNHIFFLRKQ